MQKQSPPAGRCRASPRATATLEKLLPILSLSMMLYGMGYPFGRPRSAVSAVSSPSLFTEGYEQRTEGIDAI